MQNRFYRLALVCVTAAALLLSGCGKAQAPETQPAETTVMETTMATFFFENPIKNCTYLMLPMLFSFDGTKDVSAIQLGSYFLFGELETCIKEFHGVYLEPEPEYLLKGADTFTLIDNSVGFFQMAMMDPFDVCAITALPDAAPDGWDPFDVGIETTVMLIGFPTEEDRQVFLDGLAK